MGALLAALLIACPYLWIDPMRLAKSVLGNAARGGEAMGVASAAWKMLAATSAPLTVLGPSLVDKTIEPAGSNVAPKLPLPEFGVKLTKPVAKLA